MTRTITPPDMTPQAREHLEELLDQRAAVLEVDVRVEDPLYDLHTAERELASAQLTERLLVAYAAATGRCAEHLTFTWESRPDLDRPDCRNRASRPSGLCGVHDPGWEGTVPRRERRLASMRTLQSNRELAEQLRGFGLDAQAAIDAVFLTIESARALRGLLVLASSLGVTL